MTGTRRSWCYGDNTPVKNNVLAHTTDNTRPKIMLIDFSDPSRAVALLFALNFRAIAGSETSPLTGVRVDDRRFAPLECNLKNYSESVGSALGASVEAPVTVLGKICIRRATI
jgi:hypothetical protein